jgi:hypothetical protein
VFGVADGLDHRHSERERDADTDRNVHFDGARAHAKLAAEASEA